jgi:hypothetical protein
MSLILYVIAIVLFAIAALVPLSGRDAVPVNLVALGLAFFAAGHIAT